MTFVNPYNFIPLSSKKPVKLRVQNEDSVDAKKYTGVIHYTLLTKTPLFIPNTSNEHAFIIPKDKFAEKEDASGSKIDPDKLDEHKEYDFFSYDDISGIHQNMTDSSTRMPVIPGSEIRGLVRSNYEILTNSCLSMVDDTDEHLTRRNEQTFEAGLIHRNAYGKFSLYKAKDYLLRTKGEDSLVADNPRELQHGKRAWETSEYYTRKCYRQKSLKEGARVRFVSVNNGRGKPLAERVVAADRNMEKLKQQLEGYLIKGEDGPETNSKQQKHCAHIFVLSSDANKPLSSDIDLKVLEEVLKKYDENNEGSYKEYRKQFREFKDGKGEEYFPVYYSTAVNNWYMLSPACITREVYEKKLIDMYGVHLSCKGAQELCPACSLFGVLGRSSRLRFSDLQVKDKDIDASEYYEKPVHLKELSTPKITNAEFYLKRPGNAWFWTFDYYIDANGNVKPYVASINGRKFYWHDMKCEKPNDNVKAGERSTTVRPVRRGKLFEGDVYFQDLSKKELDTLIYLLEGTQRGVTPDKKEHGYKLGSAKPLGYGSVSLGVDNVMLRKVVLDQGSHRVEKLLTPYEEYETPGLDEEIVAQYKKMTGFDSVKECIDYPRTENDPEHIYAWFVKNHIKINSSDRTKTVGMANNRTQMAFAEYLDAMEPVLKKTGALKETTTHAGGEKKTRPADAVEGTVKNTNKLENGFFFVETKKNRSVFVHVKSCRSGHDCKSLQVGDTIWLIEGRNEKGPCANEFWLE